MEVVIAEAICDKKMEETSNVNESLGSVITNFGTGVEDENLKAEFLKAEF